MEIKPITPQEAKAKQVVSIHPTLIELINEHLVKNAADKSITLKQPELINAFMERHENFDRQKLFDDNMLDFEDAYRKQGWKVRYDKPAYYEGYDAYWVFEAK